MIDDDGDTIFNNFTNSFSITRVIDNNLIATHINTKTEIFTNDESTDDDITDALAKIKIFFEDIVDGAIVFSTSNQNAFRMFFNSDGTPIASNYFMFTPDNPGDDILAAVLLAKINALGSGHILASEMKIKSNNPFGLGFTYSGTKFDILPDMKTWMPGKTYFDIPWWHRDDASTIDIIVSDDVDISIPPSWAFKIIEEEPPKTKKKKGKFKPTIINGGKD